jgi:hypothetical protein
MMMNHCFQNCIILVLAVVPFISCDENNQQMLIRTGITNDFHSHKLNSLMSASSLRGIQKQRHLQGGWTDDKICETLIQFVNETNAYPMTCSCDRTSVDASQGYFRVECTSDCEICAASDTTGQDTCGNASGNYLFMENTLNPIYSLLTESSICVQYTKGRNERVCTNVAIDMETYTGTCRIDIGGQTCNRCELTTDTSCSTSSGVASSTLRFNDKNNATSENKAIPFSYDCSNIISDVTMNACQYEPFTSTVAPSGEEFGPMGYISFDWQNVTKCSNNNPSVPVPTPVTTGSVISNKPTSAPVQGTSQQVPSSVTVPKAPSGNTSGSSTICKSTVPVLSIIGLVMGMFML